MANVLVEAWDAYLNIVYEYAEQQFNKVVKPWLKERGLNFRKTGMGSWVLSEYGDDGKRHTIYDPTEVDMPKYVLKVLSESIDGLPANDLGSLMPDYDYREDIANLGR